jgi:hypothetical protein
MRYSRVFIIIVEFFCVAIMSLCGIVSFSNSGIYAGFEKGVAGIMPSHYLSLVIFVVVFALGIFFILVRNKGAGILTIAVVILSLPSIFSYNNIDLLKIFGASAHFTTTTTYLQTLSIGSLIITSYFLLDLINHLKLHNVQLEARQASASDLKSVLLHQHLAAIILTGGALLVSLVITAVARGFQYLISKNSFTLSWWIVPVTLVCILVLGVYLHWVTTRKNN